jgi:branched-chain amino acid transport system substrate-binding protein
MGERRSVSAVLIAGVALLLAACGRDEPKPAAAPEAGQDLQVAIGVAVPLTGPQAHIGEDIRDGVRLAVDEFNASATRIGGRRVHFELLVGDDEANPTKATTVAQSLVDSKAAAVIGHFNSGASIPASRIYSDNGIPQISPGSTNPAYTQQGFKTTFRLVANDNQQGPALARFALEDLHAKAVAVIDDATAYGQGLADTFEAAARAGGAQIVAREHTTDKDTDFKAILTRIKGRQPDLVMFGGIDPQAAPMRRQMRQLGIQAVFIGGDGVQTPEFIKVAGAADAEGVYASAPGLPRDKMPGGPQFLQKFDTRFGKEVQLFAPMGYDAVFVLAEAMKRADSTDPARFLPEVGRTRYTGVIGPIAFDEHGDLRDGPVSIYQVHAGAWVPVKTIVPGGAAAAEPQTTAQPTAQSAAPAGAGGAPGAAR